MQISTRGRYAVMAMVELAAQEACAVPGCRAVVCLSEIAARQRLSLAYLEQLFGPLRRAGIVGSARGPGGGYRLARSATEITVREVIAAVNEPIHVTRCETGGPGCMAEADDPTSFGKCQTHDLWAELGRQIQLFLAGVTLADVVAGRVAGRAAPILPAADRPGPGLPAAAAG